MLHGVKLTGAAEPGDYFIDDHEYAISIANLPDLLHIAWRRGKDTATTDCRFENDCRYGLWSLKANRALELIRAGERTLTFFGAMIAPIGIRGRDMQESGHKRLEGLLSSNL